MMLKTSSCAATVATLLVVVYYAAKQVLFYNVNHISVVAAIAVADDGYYAGASAKKTANKHIIVKKPPIRGGGGGSGMAEDEDLNSNSNKNNNEDEKEEMITFIMQDSPKHNNNENKSNEKEKNEDNNNNYERNVVLDVHNEEKGITTTGSEGFFSVRSSLTTTMDSDNHFYDVEKVKRAILLVNQERRQQQQKQRDLIYSESCGSCSQSTWEQVLAFEPTTHTCMECDMVWDEDSTMQIYYRFWLGESTCTGGDFPICLPNTGSFYIASYQGRVCNAYDSCIRYEGTDRSTSEIIPSQYSYDCSNVYCGPNAQRDCYGIDYTVSCQDGQQQQEPIIPSLNEVNCNKLLDGLDSSQCSACIRNDATGLYDITCGEFLSTNGCKTHEVISYGETLKHFTVCQTGSSSIDDIMWCYVYSHKSTYLSGSNTVELSITGCQVELDGSLCSSCALCGDGTGVTAPVEADCSNVIPDSAMNECTGIYAGFFKILTSPSCDGSQQEEPESNVTSPTVQEEQPVPTAPTETSLPTLMPLPSIAETSPTEIPTAPANTSSPTSMPQVQPSTAPTTEIPTAPADTGSPTLTPLPSVAETTPTEMPTAPADMSSPTSMPQAQPSLTPTTEIPTAPADTSSPSLMPLPSIAETNPTEMPTATADTSSPTSMPQVQPSIADTTMMPASAATPLESVPTTVPISMAMQPNDDDEPTNSKTSPINGSGDGSTTAVEIGGDDTSEATSTANSHLCGYQFSMMTLVAIVAGHLVQY